MRPFAGEDGRDEEEQLVDEAGCEERRGERRAALEQERLDALRGERTQLLLERAGAQLELRPVRQRAAAEGEPPWLPRRFDVARVEPRRVGAHRPHPDRDGVRGGAQLVDAPPRVLARHAAAAGDGDTAVDGDGRLVGDERAAKGLPDPPRLVLPARREIVEQLDLDAGGAKTLEAAAVDDRIRIAGADHDAGDSRGDDGVGAGRRAAVMRARLERHVEGRAACRVSGLLKGDRLGVADSLVLVPPLADDLAVARDDCADDGMIAGLPRPRSASSSARS